MSTKSRFEEFFDIERLFGLLWKHVVLILTCGIIGAAALFLYARTFLTPLYQASTLLFVNSNTVSVGSYEIGTTSIYTASSYVDTYLQILQSRSNMELVIEQSKVPYSVEQLRNMVSASPVNNTGLFRITVTSPNPEEARTLVNLVSTILPDKVAEIVNNSSIKIVDYAVTPQHRIFPNYIQYAMIGLLAGIVLCAGVILLIAYFDDEIHNEDYLLNAYDYPVLASIPDLTSKSAGKYGYYYGSGSYGKSAKRGGVD